MPKNLSLGTLGNSLAGVLGGGIGGHLLPMLGMGGVGGAMLRAIAGVTRNLMTKA
ncbi:hypothetical protein LHP98_15585 [Rhodobacter sp. Har01]|uniref:hypothetical protein n=1 Tax=Rhodobacter sp. Har01 TaxID=2883999 RepID=UPI001D079C9D|nr:hypothetical protein [Rhodobacter sp. Har01]MCB6179544.1 hypothetical protein [Rhodobacter sp. Har01]